MSAVREKIADQIKSDNSAFIVKAFPASPPDNLGAGKVLVTVYRSALNPDKTNLTHDLEIVVITGAATITLASEDALDSALDQILLSLERVPGVLWTSASREVFEEKFQGYKVAVQTHSPNVYKNLVREEQKAV